MALAVTCRFCGGSVMNHDHDGCVEKFRKDIDDEFQKCLATNSKKREFLSPAIIKMVNSREMEFYKDYLERKKRLAETQVKIDSIKKRLQNRLKEILDAGDIIQGFQELLTPYELDEFQFKITGNVEVSVTPRY